MVRTKDSRASGQHLTIRWEVQPEDLAPGLRRVGGHPPGFQLQDHSHNGTWIRRGEKKWLLKGTRVALQNGDIVSLVRAYSCPTHGPSCDGRQAGVSDACSTESAPPEEGGVQTPLLSLLFLCGESQDPGPPARGRGEVAVAAGILPFAEAQALARAEAAGDDACEDQEPDGESWAPPARHSPLAGGGSTLWRDAEKDDGVQERFQQRTASEGAEKSGAVLLFPLRPKSASRGAPRAMPASAKQDPLLLSPSAALLPAVSPQAASVRGSGAGTPPRPAMESILADMSSPPPPPPPKTADGVRRPPSRRMATPVPGTRAESRPATGASVVREARREVGDAEHDRGDGTTAQTGARPLEAKPLPPAQALRSGRPPSRGGTHLAADEGSQMLIAEEPRDEPLPLAPWSKVCISSPSLKKKSSTDNAPTYRSLAVVTPVKLPVSASKLPLSASKRRPLQPKNDNVAVL
ncbi:hypothetical protein T484DRAFT_1788067 [Baffinella frigidus]|nr:hypothetical protein T484DRAFT_1788067 [Cryptophyta sp. CCMP2293]